MTDRAIGQPLLDLWRDLQEPAILWQVGVLAICLAAAWWLARFLRWRAPEESPHAWKLGAATLRRIVFPLLAAMLLAAGRAALSYWHSVNLLSAAVALFGALAGIRFAIYLLRLAFPAGGWLEASERAISTLIWSVLVLHVTGLLPEMVRILQDFRFTVGKEELSAWTLLRAGFWVAVTLLLALWAGSALEAQLLGASRLHPSTRAVFARLGKAVLLVVAVLVVLPLVGVDLTVLSVFGGALGVGLGFGLQKIASNYVSGFIILLDRSIRIGDLITADGQYGEVRQITTRYVVVRGMTGIEAIIPNDTLVTTTVLNHSYTDKKVRLAVRVSIAYKAAVEEALALLVEIARRQPRVIGNPPPEACVANLGDSGVELELGFWIEDPERGSLNVRSAINREVLAEFARRGIEIPFPQREVRILAAAPDRFA